MGFPAEPGSKVASPLQLHRIYVLSNFKIGMRKYKIQSPYSNDMKNLKIQNSKKKLLLHIEQTLLSTLLKYKTGCLFYFVS